MKRLAKLFEEAITNYNKTKNITLLIHAFEKICKLYRDFSPSEIFCSLMENR